MAPECPFQLCVNLHKLCMRTLVIAFWGFEAHLISFPMRCRPRAGSNSTTTSWAFSVASRIFGGGGSKSLKNSPQKIDAKGLSGGPSSGLGRPELSATNRQPPTANPKQAGDLKQALPAGGTAPTPGGGGRGVHARTQSQSPTTAIHQQPTATSRQPTPREGLELSRVGSQAALLRGSGTSGNSMTHSQAAGSARAFQVKLY